MIKMKTQGPSIRPLDRFQAQKAASKSGLLGSGALGGAVAGGALVGTGVSAVGAVGGFAGAIAGAVAGLATGFQTGSTNNAFWSPELREEPFGKTEAELEQDVVMLSEGARDIDEVEIAMLEDGLQIGDQFLSIEM